jgi:glycosyltransferase A (GT-A) superfamily protein (DUF2064 family)
MYTNQRLSILYFYKEQEHNRLVSFLSNLVNIPFPAKLIIASDKGFRDFHLGLSDEILSDFNEFLLKKGCGFEWVQESSYEAQYRRVAADLDSNFLLVLSESARMDLSFFTDLSICMSQMEKENVDALLFRSSSFLGEFGNSQKNLKLALGNRDQSYLLSASFFPKLKAQLQKLIEPNELFFASKSISSLKSNLSSWKLLFPSVNDDSLNSLFAWVKNDYIEFSPTRSEHKGSRAAVVVFVKTPGFSALKTRLGKGIGKLRAENFHLLSVKLIEKTLMEARRKLGVHCFWAVSESEALAEDIWSQFPRLLQVQGGLGLKLHSIYEQLIMDFDEIIFLGADCPQIHVEDIENCISALQKTSDFYIGPSDDGGYYLFGGKIPIHKKIWLEVPYSVENTREVFSEMLTGIGKLEVSPRIYKDVDTKEEYDEIGDLMFRKSNREDIIL